MIIVCKHTLMPGRITDYYINLTIGKNYIALSDFYDNDIMVELVDDAGEKCWYLKANFYSLESYREYRLGKIGIL